MYPGQGGARDQDWGPVDRAQGGSSGYHQGPDDWAAYDHGAGGSGPGAMTAAGVAAVVLLVLIGVFAFFLLGRPGGGGGNSTERGAATVASAVPTTSAGTPLPRTSASRAAAPAAPAAVLEECSDSGDDVLPRSGRGTTVTSCPFAEEVRDAYLGAGHRGGAAEINASSPVTGVTYSMECAPDRDAVVCRGGDNAVVYLY
ncbi:hypothetical protein G6027_08465 [Dietzia sp. SLG310A2-38A2]|uniref:hypothetical protein n=1 Tax=Dietzia sp. SLG310A2-38A2 TaxID=1630643 RepID=UPI0015FA7EBC|nr:hypothetical protein [Dietzia sp. SLG310A2-38A2]MBB1030921.1 hypothetical protein [Dietzia sp. SLG310A2-38A2]